MAVLLGNQPWVVCHADELAALADYTGRFARKEDVIQAENGRDGNDSMSADSEGFLSSSDEDEPPTTGEADL